MARAGRTYPARPILGHPPLTLAPQPGPPPPPPVVAFTLEAWPPQGQWSTADLQGQWAASAIQGQWSSGELQGQWVAGAPFPDDQAQPPRPVP